MKKSVTMTLDRRSFLNTGTAAIVTALAGIPAMTAFTGAAYAKSSAEDLLKQAITFDTHTHPGPFYRSMESLPGALKKIKASHLTGFAYSVVTDLPIMKKGRLMKRKPEKGELYQYVVSELEKGSTKLTELGVKIALNSQDIIAAKKAGAPVAMLAIEGGGFAEDRLEAIQEVYHLGARIIQPLHYNYYNPFGDIQGKSSKGGLSKEGTAFVKEMARLGMVVDVAHMTHKGVNKAADAYGGPLLLSHVAYLKRRTDTGRFKRTAMPEHAKRVVDTGGLLGVWVNDHPKIVEMLGYSSAKKLMIGNFRMLADKYGADHVCLGTDLNSTKGWFKGYEMLPELVESLQEVGFHDDEIINMLGGNVLKLFNKVIS